MSNKDPKIHALESVYAALKPLDAQSRSEVISSVFALLGMSGPAPAVTGTVQQDVPAVAAAVEPSPVATRTRPKGLTELVNERQPGTNAQRIALFAYWREKHEGITRFAREDLKSYFGKARFSPPKNYDRDFSTAVDRGWIHEDGAESYITSKGIEAVESSFEGERSYSGRTKKKSAKKPVTRKAKRSRHNAK